MLEFRIYEWKWTVTIKGFSLWLPQFLNNDTEDYLFMNWCHTTSSVLWWRISSRCLLPRIPISSRKLHPFSFAIGCSALHWQVMLIHSAQEGFPTMVLVETRRWTCKPRERMWIFNSHLQWANKCFEVTAENASFIFLLKHTFSMNNLFIVYYPNLLVCEECNYEPWLLLCNLGLLCFSFYPTKGKSGDVRSNWFSSHETWRYSFGFQLCGP